MASSEGWKVSGPTDSQRLLPLIGADASTTTSRRSDAPRPAWTSHGFAQRR
ncbi:MAG: hypothetical protein OXU63_10120 [Acidobacteriota bacterium]|nr:hypothetical protein [Acidobacteriota bacterium]